MIFSEVYGLYFKTVSEILEKAAEGGLTREELTRTVAENAFGESVVTIPAKLTDGSWPLLTEKLYTPLRAAPHVPLTTLEKQWLKVLLLDARIRLFEPSVEGLEDVEPLFEPRQFVYFDRYADGDDYSDARYIKHFRAILRAMREKRRLRVRYRDRTGGRNCSVCIPYRLEYSSKDDKFRLIAQSRGRAVTVNLSRINSVQLLGKYRAEEYRAPRERVKTLVMELYDTRKALERAMLHFSDMEKETVFLGEGHYRIKLKYRASDETEMLIRILSFGPVLRVTQPESIAELLRGRIERQLELQERK